MDAVDLPGRWRTWREQPDDERLAFLLHRLVRLDLDPVEARRHWKAILRHAEELEALQGSPVSLRTAACDYFLHRSPLVSHPVLVESAFLERQEAAALVDELTGLPNRRAFLGHLDREMERQRRTGRAFSLLLLDVDHFKRINDTHGHDVGDRVLRSLAKTLQATVRGMDLVARLGGEEFAVLLPETDASRSLRAAERYRQAVAQRETDLGRVTISVGAATFPDHAQDQDALLRGADQALYKAKLAGRNLVASADVDMRRHPRVPLRLPVVCRPLDGQGEAIAGATLNLSLGGLLMTAGDPLPSRQALMVFLEDGDPAPLAIPASPVHLAHPAPRKQQDPRDPHDAASWRVGLRFLHLDDDHRHRLHRLLPSESLGLRA